MTTSTARPRLRLIAAALAAATTLCATAGCVTTEPMAQRAATMSPTAPPAIVTPQTEALINAVRQQFPAISAVSALRPTDLDPAHRQGRAVDFMIPNSTTPAGIALGNAVVDYVWRSDPRWHVDSVLWRRAYLDSPTNAIPMEDRGSPTANHETHVHITLSPARLIRA